MKKQKFTQLNGKKNKGNKKCYLALILLSFLSLSLLCIKIKNSDVKKEVEKLENSKKLNKNPENTENSKIKEISNTPEKQENTKLEENSKNKHYSENSKNTKSSENSEKKANPPNMLLQSLYNNYKHYENKKFTDSLKNAYKIKKIYLREDKIYTQGLFFLDNKLYESGGQYNISSFLYREKKNFDYKTSKKKKEKKKYFAEGADFYKKANKTYFYQLTWQKREILKRAENFEILQKIELPKKIEEGWGISHNPLKPSIFFISDGTNKIFECDAEKNFEIIKEHKIFHKNREVNYLNELEFFNGKLWANIYPTNYMVEINLQNDRLERIYEFSKLEEIADEIMREMRGRGLRKNDECFNGIAYNWENGVILVTGKNWPVFFEIELF